MQVTSKGVKISDVVETGKEFQTSLKIDNKEVFGKIISFGTLPKNNTGTYQTNIPNDYKIFDFEIVGLGLNNVVIKIPYITTNGNFIRSSLWVTTEQYLIEIATNYDASVYEGCAIIYYTKN